MDRITADIYMGDIADAGNAEWLEEGSPTAVLKLSHSDPETPYPDAVTVRDAPMIDGPQNDYEDFATAAEAMLDLLGDHTVFVHCRAGISRSSSVTAAALAVRRDIPVGEAVDLIREGRPRIHPHPHLREQAERFVETR
jgi:protein-tyrosine phosphatase